MIKSINIVRPVLQGMWHRPLTFHMRRSQCATAPSGQVMTREKFLDHFQQSSSCREEVVYSLSFAGNCLEHDLASDNAYPLIDERMKIHLRNSYQALLTPSAFEAHKVRNMLPPQLNLGCVGSLEKKNISRKLPPLEENYSYLENADSTPQPLPKSIHQIRSFLLDEDKRPMVITEVKSPFRIVAVNQAWVNLCGYSRDECQGQSVGKLLQGPETDMKMVTAMLSKLLIGEEAKTVVTNYKKKGRKFKNCVRVGPICDEMGKTVNFVGVLREVRDVGEEQNVKSREKMQLPFIS